MKSIFVSSTYTDLQEERKAAIEILDREHHAVAMEKFFAENHQATDVCLKKLQRCDGIVLILGERYGSVDPKEHVSITEIEYTTAKALGLPIFAFIKTRTDGSWQSVESETDRAQKHRVFKERIDDEKYRREFQTPDQLKTEILGAIANHERMHGELGVRVPAFVAADEFFKPLVDPARLFNHCWTLVGRTETIDKLNFFVRSPKRIAIIFGRGTVGKTKILFEFSRTFTSEHPTKHLLFLREGVPLDQESIKQIPAQPTIIVVDDAHRRTDFKFLLQIAQQYSERVKLIFSARPQGKDFIKTGLAETGFGTPDIDDLGELKDLSRTELKQLAAEGLGQSNAHLADQLVAATGDSPLVTLVGAQLLVNHSIDPPLLERHEAFQFAVLSRFEDAITGKISPKIDGQLAQRVLALISVLAPIRPHDPHFQEALAEFLGIEKRTLIDVIGALEEQGVLLRRGYLLRIAPDVLSDHILHKACLTQSGQPTGFAEDVFQQFAKVAAERVLVNLAELDWRIGKTSGKSALLDRIWADIDRSFRTGSNYERSMILEWLGKIAYYQPARALALVEFAIRHPSNCSGNKNLQAIYKFTHMDIIRGLPKVIQAIGYNIDYLPRCCDLLWELGRDDTRQPNSNLDSPMRVLLDFAKYDIGKPFYVNRTVLDAAERWLKQPACHSHVNSPLDILDVLLEKEGMSSRSEGIKVLLQSFPVSPKNTKELRQRAIKLIEAGAHSDSIRVVIRSLHSLSEALRPPHGSLGRSVTTEEQKHWTRERRQILDIIFKIVGSNKNPLIHIHITRDLRWYAQHASPKALQEKAKSIIKSIPQTFEYLLNKALWYNSWDWDDELEDKDPRDHIKRAQETEKQVRLIVEAFLRKYPKPTRGFRILTRCLEKFERAGIAPSPGYFLNILSRTNPTYAAKMCRLLVQRSSCNLAPYMANLLAGVRRDKPLVAKNIINKAIETKNETVSAAAAQFYNWNEDIDGDDLIAIKRLLNHSSSRVKKMAVHALAGFKDKWHRDVIDVIKTVKVSKNTDLAEDICRVFNGKNEKYGIPFSALRDGDISAILSQLVHIPEIGDHHYYTDKFLGYATERKPYLVARLFFKRLDVRSKQEKHRGSYHPLPFLGFRFAFKGISSKRDYAKIILELLRRAARADSSDNFWLPIFFKAVSDGYCEIGLATLRPWVISGNRRKIEAAVLLLRSAPSSFFFEHRDFVIEILESAHSISDDCYKNVGSDLFSCAVSGLREGTPGEPKSHDVNIRDRATEALTKLQPGSPAHRFYESLVQYAEREIKDDLARFEEDFGD